MTGLKERDGADAGRRHLQDFRPGLPDKGYHRGGNEAFHNADGQVDRLHHQHEGGEGQLRNTREPRFQHHPKGPHLQAQDGGGHGPQQDAALGRPLSHQLFINQRVGDKTGEKAEIEDVAPQGQEPAVGEEQGLHREDGGHGEKGGIRSQQDGENHAAAQVAAGTGGRNGEVDHLGRKHKGPQDPHEGELAFVHFLLELPGAVDGEPGGGGPHRTAHRGEIKASAMCIGISP